MQLQSPPLNDTKKHVDALSRKVYRALGVLKHAKKFLQQNILKNLYISIIESHFRYCSSVWGCCSTTYINRLQKLQNRAVRMITNSAFDTPAKPLLANLGLRSMSELNENELKLITYKSLNDLAPNCFRQLLIRNSQKSCRALRNTDRDLKLQLIMGKKDILSEKQNRGMVSQPVLNVHHLWHLLNLICKWLF